MCIDSRYSKLERLIDCILRISFPSKEEAQIAWRGRSSSSKRVGTGSKPVETRSDCSYRGITLVRRLQLTVD